MLQKIFNQLGIINWKTTMTGIGGFGLAITIIINAYRTKDFLTIFSQIQTLGPIFAGVLLGLQGFAAKDSTVTGVGTQAASLTDNNKLLTVQGDTVKNPEPGA